MAGTSSYFYGDGVRSAAGTVMIPRRDAETDIIWVGHYSLAGVGLSKKIRYLVLNWTLGET